MERSESMTPSAITTNVRGDHALQEGEKEEVKGEVVVLSASSQGSEVKRTGRRLPVTSTAITLFILVWLLRFLYY